MEHDFSHIIDPLNPNYDIRTYIGGSGQSSVAEWRMWVKPRGCKWVYIVAHGGGSSGGTGVNTSTSSGGGAGGQAGGQTSVWLPALAVPSQMYVWCGAGGAARTASGQAGLAGSNTYVALEPYQTAAQIPSGATNPNTQIVVCMARGGSATGTAASTTAGGAVGTAAVAATSAQMQWGWFRGFTSAIAGVTGTAGGACNAVGSAMTMPTNGNMCTGGTGGGGCNATSQSAGGLRNLLGISQYVANTPGGVAASGATPAAGGSGGVSIMQGVSPLFFIGGQGGGGSSNTAGGLAGRGGVGAPGCGGGGGGGMRTVNSTIAPSGDGGPGFVIIVSG